MTQNRWDTLIVNGLVFDGAGGPPHRQDVAIQDGRIAARGPALDRSQALDVVDVAGAWVCPGFLDIHTHFDLEVELAPGLPEAVRHGTTTVLVSNCSLGLAYGAQRRGDEDPIVDCFARVENIPKPVLRKVADQVTWSTSAGYLEHLDGLALGPNIAPMIPHSMLRAEVMGLRASVTRDPTPDELDAMRDLVETGMEEGYVGFSTDALPFHYLANDPGRRTKIPSQWASHHEIKTLTNVVRAWDRVWQATPPKDNPLAVARSFFLSAGRITRRPLRLTAVAAMDVAANASLVKLALILTRLINAPLFNGRFRLQALAAPFKVYWDGPINPLAEEIDTLRQLNEPDLEDRPARQALLRDPAFRAAFAKMWMTGKTGFGPARLARLMRREGMAFRRDIAEMVIHSGGPPSWTDQTFAQVHARYLAWRAAEGDVAGGASPPSMNADEAAVFAALPQDALGEAEFVLALFAHFDTDLRWWVVSANRDPETVRRLLYDEQLLPGFNDSGAHLTNMAFYDGALRGLKIAQADGLDRVASHVRRLTKDPADFFGLDVGGLAIGDQADIAIIDPDALARYDSDAHTVFVYRDAFEHEQLVNRSDGVVTHTFIAGALVWDGSAHTSALGQRKLGRALRHRDHAGVDSLARADRAAGQVAAE